MSNTTTAGLATLSSNRVKLFRLLDLWRIERLRVQTLVRTSPFPNSLIPRRWTRCPLDEIRNWVPCDTDKETDAICLLKYLQFFTSHILMQRYCPIWPWLTDFRGVVLHCFKHSRSTTFTEVSPMKLKTCLYHCMRLFFIQCRGSGKLWIKGSKMHSHLQH